MAKKNPFEGSALDKKQDKAGAKKSGLSLKSYEKSPMDKKQDKAAKGFKPFGKK